MVFFLLSVAPFFASIFIHKKVDTPFNDQPFMRGTTKNQNKVGTYLWDTLYYKYFIFPYHKYKCSVIMLCKQLNYAFIMDVGIYWYDTDEDCGYLHCIIKCIFYSAHKTLRQIQKRWRALDHSGCSDTIRWDAIRCRRKVCGANEMQWLLISRIRSGTSDKKQTHEHTNTISSHRYKGARSGWLDKMLR